MAVTFVLGRGGAGKTRTCLDALLSELEQGEDGRRLILLVPEQASFQMERALATRAARRGYSRAEVLSFSRLAQHVLQQVGPDPDVLSPQARSLAIRRVVSRGADALRRLGTVVRTEGFITELDRLIDELLRENVPPQRLLDAADRMQDARSARKIREIEWVYAEYLAWLSESRIDPAARLAALRDRLDRLPWLRDAGVWVDGFAGFTGQELETLVAAARIARDVTITLLVDPHSLAVQQPRHVSDALSLFHRTEETYQRLRRQFEEAGVDIGPTIELHPRTLPRFEASPGLAMLEAGLAAPVETSEESPAEMGLSGDSPAGVRLLECATHRDELRAAARWIRTMVVDSGGRLRFRDFAVIARDLQPFAELAAEVFTEYGIPFFLDRRRPLRAHALSRLVPALLDAVSSDFDVQPMVALLRTRLLPVSRDESERLENIVVKNSVRGLGLWQRTSWDWGGAGGDSDPLADPRERIIAGLEPIVSRLEPAEPATGADWARTLHAVLTQLSVRERIESWIADARAQRRWESAETHRLAWESLSEVLQHLHEVLADTPVSAGEVRAIVGAAVADLTLGLAPPTVDQVLVSSVERSRHPDVKHAWVLAFNEGVFPARPADDTLLGTAERDALQAAGLPGLAPRRDDVLGERLLAYIALTRPSTSLTISYANSGEDGDMLLPSPLLADVLRALPGLIVQPADPNEQPVSVSEAARGYLRSRDEAAESRERQRYEAVCQRLRETPASAGELTWLLRGVDYRNDPDPVGTYRQKETGGGDVVWDGSPSEAETYLQCPFKHFARYGLRLDPERGPHPLRWDLGDAAHELLADVTRRAMAEDGGVRAVSDERWQELLDAAVSAYRRRRPGPSTECRPDFAFMSGLLVELLRDLVLVHAARWRRGRFDPLCCEQTFGNRPGAGGFPGVELRMPDGQRVRMHGQIDRVDVYKDEHSKSLLVYDYKSSVDTVASEFLTGSRLQLFVYALALQQAWGGDDQSDLGGVLLAPLYPDLSVLGRKYVAEATDAEQRVYMFRPRGLLATQAAHRLDDQLGPKPSPVANLRLKKDGDFYANCDARPASEIRRRLELARRTVLMAADGIARGRIDVSPLVEKRTLACRTCDFRILCRFDRMLNRPRAAETSLPVLGDVPAEAGGDTCD